MGEIMTNFFLPDDQIECVFCGENSKKQTKRIEKVSKLLIIHAPRSRKDQAEANIRCPTDAVKITDINNKSIMYKVAGVITHKKTEVGTNHYIYNHYIKEEQKWLTIDDKNMYLEDSENSNEQGTIF